LFATEIIVLTTLAIAGWRIRLESSLPVVDEAVASHFRAFVVPDGAANDARVTVSLDPDVPAGEWPARQVTRQEDVCLFDMPGACGRIALDCWQGTVKLGRQNLGQNLEHFLKALFAYMAFHQGGLLFHCAGVLAGRAAYLFTGESGSGKSTVVSLLSHRPALNDDLIVLRPDGREWRAYGTPFWNVQTTRRSSGQTADGVVVGIYRLVQDQQVYLEPISSAIAVSELMANCPIVNTDPVELPALVSRCRELAQAVKVQRLHFRESPDFWTILQNVRM
jgi:hypothetical protein